MSEYALLLKEEGATENLLGNYAFVRGMIEGGVQVATCYPGSPTAEMADALMAIGRQADISFEISTNEKVALEIAATSAIVGRPSVCWMKSVGLNVASDTAVQLAYLSVPGGLVVILGDDPGVLSSQNEQDNRYFARLGLFPLLEPASPQESKDYFLYAMQLSRTIEMPVFIRATTRTCHQTGPVKFGPRQRVTDPPVWNNERMTARGGYVPLPGTLLALKRKALENLRRFEQEVEAFGVNRVVRVGKGEPAAAIVTYGHPFQSVVSALEALNVSADVLKLGVTFPLPRAVLSDFLRGRDEVLVLEELDPVLENDLKVLVVDQGLNTRIVGKTGIENELDLRIGEYTPTRMAGILAQRLAIPNLPAYAESAVPVPSRSPQLCPGCGHRTSFYAAKKAVGEGKEAFTVADIGCYSLGYLPPYRLGNLLYCMGSGAPAASAMAHAFPDEPVMSFVGDSTFFHAAMPGIVNAVYNKHRQVIMVMDNGITAMTGHQPNPNSGYGASGETVRISIDEVLKAFGVKFVERVPAYDCAKVEDALKRALDFARTPDGGVAVVIQEEPCALMRSRAERKAGALAPPLEIDYEVCRNIRECLTGFACPAIELTDDQRVAINTDLCIGCGTCVQTCPLKTKPLKRIEGFERV
jgi:indolepyruvate ferredoxin oxidoreductase alpha subunit